MPGRLIDVLELLKRDFLQGEDVQKVNYSLEFVARSKGGGSLGISNLRK